VISVLIGLTYITYNIVSITFVYGHFLEDMIQAQFARLSAGMDAVNAAHLLDTLRAEMTLKSLVVGNLMAVCRLGTAFSLLIALGFVKRWRRAGRAVPEAV